MSKYLIILLSVFLFSCSENNVAPKKNISPTAKTYLNHALDIMENHSINRYKIDWLSFRKNTINYAGNAQTTADTYYAIRFALKNLGDHHSFFRPPQTKSAVNPGIPLSNQPNSSSSESSSGITGIRIDPHIGYIRIPAFSGDQINSFATDIQSTVTRLDSTSVRGWIVDLRYNTGGNMWPMLAGIGPILGEGLAGYFIDPDTTIYKWYYEDGKSILNEKTIAQVDDYYTLFNKNPYVAVLTDNKTASSGEAITIAFIGRPNTKSFGDYTAGLSTANDSFTLSDGAIIWLTEATMADRNQNLYGKKIKPDKIVLGPFKEDPKNDDTVVEAAIDWIKNKI